MSWQLPPTYAPQPQDDAGAPSEPSFRFRIIHLLWVGVWLSLLLTIIRLSKIPYDLILPAILGWLLYQTTTLLAGRLIARQLGPWWTARRQGRST